MRFRCLEDHECKEHGHGKYEGPQGTTTHLFNVRDLHRADSVIAITEGELDALCGSAHGLPAVGVPGANNWKPFYHRLFDDFERVIVIGDGDSAGRQFTGKLCGAISAAIPRPMPEGHDVTSYVIEHGQEAFLDYVGVNHD